MNIQILQKKFALTAALFVTSLCLHAQGKIQKPAAVDMTETKPEAVGFSSERLERLHALMQEAVDKKYQAGVVTILARHGKVVDYRAYGERDMASHAPMTKDTIFRDYSMTKPVTGVAMMILYEQGKWLPSDPISKFIPEFKDLKVFKGVNGEGKMILADPDHAPTMRELMTHTAGFTYGFFGDTAVDDREAGEDSAGLSTGLAVALQRFDGYSGVYRGEVIRKDTSGFHARTHLRAAGDEGCGILCSGGQAWPVHDAIPLRDQWGAGGRCQCRAEPERLRSCAVTAIGRRRYGFDGGRLLSVCVDAGARW